MNDRDHQRIHKIQTQLQALVFEIQDLLFDNLHPGARPKEEFTKPKKPDGMARVRVVLQANTFCKRCGRDLVEGMYGWWARGRGTICCECADEYGSNWNGDPEL